MVVGWVCLGSDPPRVLSVFSDISSLAPIARLDVFLDDILLIQINPRLLLLHCVHRINVAGQPGA